MSSFQTYSKDTFPCFFPDNYGYSLYGPVSEEPHGRGLTAILARSANVGSFVGGDFELLKLEVQFQTNERVRIKIT